MAEVHDLDGFQIGDRVRFNPAIGNTGSTMRTGEIQSLKIGVHGNYAKIKPDYGNVIYVTKLTSDIELVGNL